MLARTDSLGLSLRSHIASGALQIQQIDPAEMSPGKFSSRVREAVEEQGVSIVAIDSLNAYLQSMPGSRYLLLQMHELLGFLNQKGVMTLVVLGQHGLIGDVSTDIDLSYLSDTIILFRFFEASGTVLSAISVVKSRTNAHERSIREFRLDAKGVRVGAPLKDFDGIFGGIARYTGDAEMLKARSSSSD